LNFVPITHIAVNPQPLPPGQTLPPSVLVELDSLVPPALDANDKGSISIHFSGIKSDKVTVMSPSGTLQQWFVETLYDLEISETIAFTPPDPSSAQAGSFDATFSATGTGTAFLVPQAPSSGVALINLFAWLEQMTINQLGEISGPLNPTSPAAPVVNTFTWNSLITESGTETPFFAPGTITAPPGPNNMPWNFAVHMPSVGQEVIVDFLEGEPDQPIVIGQVMGSSFTQIDQATVCFMPAPVPGLPPGPCVTVEAAISTAGSVTDVLIPTTPFTPEVDTGAVQYTDSLMETIVIPDGSTQTLTQTSQDSGTFIIAVLVG
jgi:hypothetical protein